MPSALILACLIVGVTDGDTLIAPCDVEGEPQAVTVRRRFALGAGQVGFEAMSNHGTTADRDHSRCCRCRSMLQNGCERKSACFCRVRDALRRW